MEPWAMCLSMPQSRAAAGFLAKGLLTFDSLKLQVSHGLLTLLKGLKQPRPSTGRCS